MSEKPNPRVRLKSDGDGTTTRLEVLKLDKLGRRRWVEFPKARSADFHFEVGKDNTASVEVFAWSAEMEAVLVDLKVLNPLPPDRSGVYLTLHAPYRTTFGRWRQRVTIERRTEAGVEQGLLVETLAEFTIRGLSDWVGNEFKVVT